MQRARDTNVAGPYLSLPSRDLLIDSLIGGSVDHVGEDGALQRGMHNVRKMVTCISREEHLILAWLLRKLSSSRRDDGLGYDGNVRRDAPAMDPKHPTQCHLWPSTVKQISSTSLPLRSSTDHPSETYRRR